MWEFADLTMEKNHFNCDKTVITILKIELKKCSDSFKKLCSIVFSKKCRTKFISKRDKDE